MKKKIALLMISMLALLLIAGCSSDASGGKEDSGAETTASAAADQENTGTQKDTSVDGKQDVIGDTKAKGIALAKVTGAKESDVTKFKLETDDGKQKYEGEIRYKGKEYDFDIDAVTGEVLEWEEEAIND